MRIFNPIRTHLNSLSIYCGLCLLILTSCSTGSGSAGSEPAIQAEEETNPYTLTITQFSTSDMELGKLEMKAFHDVVKATGMFDVPPQNRASVSTYFGGTVKNIKLLPGEKVRRGQTLFLLENPEYVQMQQDYLEAKGQLVALRANYERQKNLVEDNITSQKNYLQAESDYNVTEVKFQSLDKKLSLLGINPSTLTVENIQTSIPIKSPINGYITEISVSRGTYLNPSQPAMTIVDTDHLHIELNIFEKDLPKVKEGQTIVFKLQNNHEKEYNATVYLVNPSVDPESRKVGLHGHLSEDETSSFFSPGMYVEADILTTSNTKPALPQSALVEVEGSYFVLVLISRDQQNLTFEKQEVIPGTMLEDYVQVLNAGDFGEDAQFLTKGSFNLITE